MTGCASLVPATARLGLLRVLRRSGRVPDIGILELIVLLIIEVIFRPLHKMPVGSLILAIMCMSSILVQVLMLLRHMMMLERLETAKAIETWRLWLLRLPRESVHNRVQVLNWVSEIMSGRCTMR